MWHIPSFINRAVKEYWMSRFKRISLITLCTDLVLAHENFHNCKLNKLSFLVCWSNSLFLQTQKLKRSLFFVIFFLFLVNQLCYLSCFTIKRNWDATGNYFRGGDTSSEIKVGLINVKTVKNERKSVTSTVMGFNRLVTLQIRGSTVAIAKLHIIDITLATCNKGCGRTKCHKSQLLRISKF